VRAVVWFCLVSGPMMLVGWTNHWIVLGAAFVAGLIAVAPLTLPESPRRGGFVHPQSPLNDRIGRYTERGRDG
jgi:hypothetical protein